MANYSLDILLSQIWTSPLLHEVQDGSNSDGVQGNSDGVQGNSDGARGNSDGAQGNSDGDALKDPRQPWPKADVAVNILPLPKSGWAPPCYDENRTIRL